MKKIAVLLIIFALFVGCAAQNNTSSEPSSSEPSSSQTPASSETVSEIPTPSVTVSSNAVFQGDMLTVTATALNNPTITTTLDFSAQFFPDGEVHTSHIPVSYKTKESEYTITVTADNFEQTLTFEVKKFNFDIQNMYIDQTIADETVNSSEADWELYVKMKPVKALSDNVKYYTENFIQPLKGEITTEYGMIRYVNDEPTSSRHSGIDIATAQGTPIVATNSGRVILAEYLQMTGNTIVIEHGFGLKSIYYHMSELNVKVDDMVNRGDVIGKVGSTGFSTGPHLHFSMAVNNVWVNPWLFFPDERVTNE